MLLRLTRAEQPAFDGVASVRVAVTIRALEGVVDGPSIIVDWGDGLELGEPVALKPVGDDVYAVVVHTSAGALSQVLFRPSKTPGLFKIEAFRVEPASEPSGAAPRLSAPRRLLRAGLRKVSQTRPAGFGPACGACATRAA